MCSSGQYNTKHNTKDISGSSHSPTITIRQVLCSFQSLPLNMEKNDFFVSCLMWVYIKPSTYIDIVMKYEVSLPLFCRPLRQQQEKLLKIMQQVNVKAGFKRSIFQCLSHVFIHQDHISSESHDFLSSYTVNMLFLPDSIYGSWNNSKLLWTPEINE